MLLLLLLLLPWTLHARPDRKKTLIIADVSASVRNSDEINPDWVKRALKHAMESYLPTGRNNKVMLYECATRSQLLLDWTSVREKATIIAAIDRMTFDWDYEESFTNWEACLASALDKDAKNVYFITDGNPTTYVGQPGNPPSDDAALNMQKAVAMADAVKAQGSTLTPLGVGEYVTNANLARIAGPCGHECWSGYNYFHLTNFRDLRDGVRDGLIVHNSRMADEKALEYVHTNKREAVDPETDDWILSAMDGRVLDSSSPRYRDKGETLEGVVGRDPADLAPLFWPMGDERVRVHHKMNGRYVRNRLVTIPGTARGIVGVRTHLALRATCEECVDNQTACVSGCGVPCRFCRDAWEIGSPLAEFCAINNQWLTLLACLCSPTACNTDCFGECGFTLTPTTPPPPTTTTTTTTENPTQSPTGSPTSAPSASPTQSPTAVSSLSPTAAPTQAPVPTPAPTTTTTGPESGTCLVHAWNDINANGIQEGLTRRREVMEPDLEGLKVTLIDSLNVMHMGFTDANGNIEFPNVAPGPGVVTVLVPAGWLLSTPPENPFDVDVPPGPGAHSIPAIGLREVEGPAVPEPRTLMMNIGAREIVAIVIGVLILMLLVGFILRAVCAQEPWVWDTYTDVRVEETEVLDTQTLPVAAAATHSRTRRIDYDCVSAVAMPVDYPCVSPAAGGGGEYTVRKGITPGKKNK